jgi:hypothetical protein
MIDIEKRDGYTPGKTYLTDLALGAERVGLLRGKWEEVI